MKNLLDKMIEKYQKIKNEHISNSKMDKFYNGYGEVDCLNCVIKDLQSLKQSMQEQSTVSEDPNALTIAYMQGKSDGRKEQSNDEVKIDENTSDGYHSTD